MKVIWFSQFGKGGAIGFWGYTRGLESSVGTTAAFKRKWFTIMERV
jgi:hypothetical protein